MANRLYNTGLHAAPKLNALQNILAAHEARGEHVALPLAGNLRRSILVFKENKYFAVTVENIAFFYVRNGSPYLVCMDRREYPVNHSLDQMQELLAGKQFFRVNRQYLINFSAIKEVEHYFARKLLVNLIMSTSDKLLVPKDKTKLFMKWLENG